MNPGTEVSFPDWLKDPLQKLLGNTADLYGDFQQKGAAKVGDDFWKRNARDIARLTDAERQGISLTRNAGKRGKSDLMASRRLMNKAMSRSPAMNEYMDLFMGRGDQSNLRESRKLLDLSGEISNEQVTGRHLGSDPAIAQARDQFNKAMLPTIQNQATRQGLGRSTSLNAATGAAQSTYMLPLITGGLEREERSIDRRAGSAMGRGGELFRRDMERGSQLFGADESRRNRLFQGAAGRQALGGDLFNRALTQAQAVTAAGSNQRGVQQSRMDSKFNDLMRRFGAYEQGIAGPLSMVSGVLGSRSSKF